MRTNWLFLLCIALLFSCESKKTNIIMQSPSIKIARENNVLRKIYYPKNNEDNSFLEKEFIEAWTENLWYYDTSNDIHKLDSVILYIRLKNNPILGNIVVSCADSKGSVSYHRDKIGILLGNNESDTIKVIFEAKELPSSTIITFLNDNIR